MGCTSSTCPRTPPTSRASSATGINLNSSSETTFISKLIKSVSFLLLRIGASALDGPKLLLLGGLHAFLLLHVHVFGPGLLLWRWHLLLLLMLGRTGMWDCLLVLLEGACDLDLPSLLAEWHWFGSLLEQIQRAASRLASEWDFIQLVPPGVGDLDVLQRLGLCARRISLLRRVLDERLQVLFSHSTT